MISRIYSKIYYRLTGRQNLRELIRLGLKIGKNVNIQKGCNIDESHCWLISIGDEATLAPGVRIIAHDASTKKYLNYTRIGLISIGDKTFIGAGAIILPGVTIGSNCVIGAGSVIARDVPDNCVYAGNPAKFIRKTDEYIKKNKELMKLRPVYDKGWRIGKISKKKKEQMSAALRDGVGFVE